MVAASLDSSKDPFHASMIGRAVSAMGRSQGAAPTPAKHGVVATVVSAWTR